MSVSKCEVENFVPAASVILAPKTTIHIVVFVKLVVGVREDSRSALAVETLC